MEIQKLLTKLSDSTHVSRSFGPSSEHGEVRWVPAIDATRVAIAAISLVKLVTKVRARARR